MNLWRSTIKKKPRLSCQLRSTLKERRALRRQQLGDAGPSGAAATAHTDRSGTTAPGAAAADAIAAAAAAADTAAPSAAANGSTAAGTAPSEDALTGAAGVGGAPADVGTHGAHSAEIAVPASPNRSDGMESEDAVHDDDSDSMSEGASIGSMDSDDLGFLGDGLALTAQAAGGQEAAQAAGTSDPTAMSGDQRGVHGPMEDQENDPCAALNVPLSAAQGDAPLGPEEDADGHGPAKRRRIARVLLDM